MVHLVQAVSEENNKKKGLFIIREMQTYKTSIHLGFPGQEVRKMFNMSLSQA